MADDPAAQATEGDKKILHTYPLVKVLNRIVSFHFLFFKNQRTEKNRAKDNKRKTKNQKNLKYDLIMLNFV